MANIVRLKRSSVAGKQPNVADLEVGELAVNLADGILYSKNTAGNIVVVGSATTSNVEEGINLYFTNTRAISAFTAGTGIIIDSNGLISSNVVSGGTPGGSNTQIQFNDDGSFGASANLTWNGTELFISGMANVTGNVVVGGTVTGNGISITTVSNTAPVGAEQGDIWINSDDGTQYIYFQDEDSSQWVELASYNNVEVNISGSNLTSVSSNIIPASNATFDIGSQSLRWNDVWLADSTIYIGNAKISANATSLVLTNSDGSPFTSGTGGGAVTSVANRTGDVVLTNADISGLTTANVVELNNLYYTNARVESYLTEGGYQTAANILANVEVGSNISGNTTADLNEGTNLYYTNARVESYLTEGGYQTAANILANVTVGSNISGNTTTDLNEGTNLYYTNARVEGYLTESGYQTAANILANVTGTPGGSNTQIQFNDDGSFGGSSNLTWDGSELSITGVADITGNLTVGGTVTGNGIPITTVSNIAPLNPEQGDIWIDPDTGVQLIYFSDGNSSQWAEMEASISISVTGSAVDLSAVNQNIIPSANVTYNLGSPDKRWKDLWLSNSTIHIGEVQISASGNTLQLPNSLQIGNVIISESEGSLQLPENISAATITATGNIAGNYLLGNGSLLTGIVTSGPATSDSGVFLNSNTITSNVVISNGYNGFSVGPVTQSSGVQVAVGAGSRYVVI
jgi:hypothetical protein